MRHYFQEDYLLPAQRNSVFKQAPDDSFSTARRSEGAVVAKVLSHVALRRNEHVQGHIPQCGAAGWFYKTLTRQ